MFSLHYGGVFGCGTLLFVGHDLVLHRLAHGKTVDDAPWMYSGLAGAAGGLLYNIPNIAINLYLRHGNLKTIVTTNTFSKAYPFSLVRDVGGFGIYFAVYTLIRGESNLVSRLPQDGRFLSGAGPPPTTDLMPERATDLVLREPQTLC